MPNAIVIQLDCQTPKFKKLPLNSQEPLDLRLGDIYLASKNQFKKTQFTGNLRIIGLSTQGTEIADKLCQFSKTLGATNFADKKVDYQHPIQFSKIEFSSTDFVGTLKQLIAESNLKIQHDRGPPVIMLKDEALSDEDNENSALQESSSHSDSEPTCQLESRGTLYYNPANQLQLCSGRNWIHLASAGPRLDYISLHQKLKIDSQSNDIEIFNLEKIGIFLINAELDSRNEKNKRICSLYKFKGGQFVKYQTIRTRVSNSWTYFKIGKTHFLEGWGFLGWLIQNFALKIKSNVKKWHPKNSTTTPYAPPIAKTPNVKKPLTLTCILTATNAKNSFLFKNFKLTRR